MNPTWTLEKIDAEWLGGGKLAVPSDDIVAAFNRAEQVLGLEWIESSRIRPGGEVRGLGPTLHVVTVGQMLASLEGVGGTDELIQKLHSGAESAFAELTAVHLIRSGELAATIELGPTAQVGERNRKPDFRARREETPWTYVEVTQPDIAEAEMRAQAVLNRLSDLVRPIKRGFALEIFLRREPTDSELDALAETRTAVLSVGGRSVKRFARPGDTVPQYIRTWPSGATRTSG